MQLKRSCIILFFLLTGCILWGQNSVKSIDRTQKKSQSNEIQKAASKLSTSLDKNASEAEIAIEYEALANELEAKKEYSKAEDYLNRAKQIYIKVNDKEKWYTINRRIARLQELQGKYNDAIENYEEASKTTDDKLKKQLNRNDIARIRNILEPEAQSEFIQQNIDILENKNLPQQEKVEVYKQMAENSLQMDNKDVAIKNYKKAMENLSGKEPEVLKLEKKIADVYVADEQYEKAIDINKRLITKTVEINDIDAQIEQLKSLSEVYLIDNKRKEGIATLQQAYDLALKEGRTIEAKTCVERLVEELVKEKKYQESIDLYHGYLGRLEALIQSDSTLIDSKIFQITEDKIMQLEKEKVLKDKLIKEKNTFNYVLIISVVLLALLLFLIVKSFYAIKNKNKKIALQSLRREMNPHFIFNSLNSVNQFIAQSNELEANKYLTSYSKLMRNMMENSNKDFIKLNKELEQLNEYLQLEQLRFSDKFSYAVTVAEDIDPETISVPNMLIQPQLENAIWHGLRYKEEKGFLKLNIIQENKQIIITIEDNGIGLTRSREIKTANQKVHESRGLTNVKERIHLLNELYKTNIRLDIQEKEAPETGVIVTLIC